LRSGALYSERVFTLSPAGAGQSDQAAPLTDGLDEIRKPKYPERVRERARHTAVRRTRRKARDQTCPKSLASLRHRHNKSLAFSATESACRVAGIFSAACRRHPLSSHCRAVRCIKRMTALHTSCWHYARRLAHSLLSCPFASK
jgi:hypothetical protein